MSPYNYLLPEINVVYLQQQLYDHFKLDELELLCFDMGIKYEDLPGDETITARTRELVKFFCSQARIPELVKYCQGLRPNVKWDQPATGKQTNRIPDEWLEPLQRLYQLVKAFNRNRQQPFSLQRTLDGDDIAFAMREAAPFVLGQFDVERWLNSGNAGKRLAAVKHLDWLQDTEFVDNLVGKLKTEKPFMQLHVLIALDSLSEQLSLSQRRALKDALQAYEIEDKGDGSLIFWRQRLLGSLPK